MKEEYLKLPYSEYLKIQEYLRRVRESLDENGKNYHDVLYCSNSLFECTHGFENGKPDLFKD